MSFSLERKITLSFGVALAVIFLVATVTWLTVTRVQSAFQSVDHTHRVINELAVTLNHVQSVQIESHRFIITADPSSLERWADAVERSQKSLQALRNLTADNPGQQERLTQLAPLLLEEATLTQLRQDLRQKSGLEAAAAEVAKGEVRQVVDRITLLLQAMRDTELSLLEERSKKTQATGQASVGLVFVTCIGALALSVAAITLVHRDFHRLKVAEAARQDYADRVHDLYNLAPCGYHSLDQHGTLVDINDTELTWLGYSREEVIGKKRFVDLVTPTSASVFQELFPRFVREGHVENVEFEMVRRNGTILIVLINAVAVRDGAGKFISSRTSLYDITGRKQAELERDRFFELSPDLLCIADFDGYFRRLNAAWEKTLGFTNEELMAKPLREFVHPDDHVRNSAERARQFTGGKTINFENRYRCKNGSYRWLRWNAYPLVSERLIYASARDITDEKRMAQVHLEFHALFESLPGLYLVLRPDLIIVAASDAYLIATHTRRELILGKEMFEAFPDNPEDPTADGVSNLRASLDRVRQQLVTDTMAIQRYAVRRPDGTFEERFWSPVNSPVLGADREIKYIIHRVEDVTEFVRLKRSHGTGDASELKANLERMEAEVFRSSQHVQAANQQLRAANQELEAFSYSVSHDLRAPLRHIDGFVGLLQKQAGAALDTKSQRYITVISDSARQMGRLIDDLLAFSRINRSHLSFSEIDHSALVASILQEERFQKTSPPIDWQISPLPRVVADSALLRQVWINLIDNAVKYSGKNPHPRIEIGSQTDPKTEEIQFYVRDNGVGFDMQYADKLFGVFQRLHSPSEFEGTGIGLANVYRIIARHGGRTWAQAKLGQGATFYFSLPPRDA